MGADAELKAAALQWSRGRMTAESGVADRDTRRPRSASMEPRSDDRGEVAAQLLARAGVLASMEPRSDDRGETSESRASACGRLSFNGAAVG